MVEASLVSVLDDLEQVGRLLSGKGPQGQVIEDEYVESGPAGQQPRQTPVGAGDADVLQQAWDAQVEDAVTVSESGLSQRAGQEGLADAGRAGDQDVAVGLDPVRLGQAQHGAAVEATGRPEVEILDAGLSTQLRRLEVALEAPVVAVLRLTVDEQAESVLEAQLQVLGLLELLTEGDGHAAQAEVVELLQGRVDEHAVLPHW